MYWLFETPQEPPVVVPTPRRPIIYVDQDEYCNLFDENGAIRHGTIYIDENGVPRVVDSGTVLAEFDLCVSSSLKDLTYALPINEERVAGEKERKAKEEADFNTMALVNLCAAIAAVD
jgi:hypothetical protein